MRRTPLLETDLGALKAESLQVTGSFKPRGALNAVLAALEEGAGPPGLITASSGNHGQALAWAAARVGLPAMVVMAADSSPRKLAAVADLGAEVVSAGVSMANREQVLSRLAAESGYLLVHPFDDWAVIHGQATMTLEVLEDAPGLDQLVVPVGGGGLISGAALALRSSERQVRLVGVEPEAADDATRSWRTGTRVERPAGPTLADGARVPVIGRRSFEVMCARRMVDAMVTVSEADLEEATAALWNRARLVVEPTGALALAAVLSGRVPGGPGTVAVVSGGNVDPSAVRRIFR